MSKKKYNNRNVSRVENTEYSKDYITNEYVYEMNDTQGSVAVVDANVVESEPSYAVKVDIERLNIRKGPGKNYDKTGLYTGIGMFTIIETHAGEGSNSGWGKLESGKGWISLDFAKRV